MIIEIQETRVWDIDIEEIKDLWPESYDKHTIRGVRDDQFIRKLFIDLSSKDISFLFGEPEEERYIEVYDE
jgi:hypothetical protein